MNIEKLKSGSYRIRQTYKGVRYTVTVPYKPSKKDCIQLMAEELNKAAAPRYRWTFETAANNYINVKEAVLSESTIKSYCSVLRSISDNFKALLLTDITASDVQEEISRYAKIAKAKTVSNMHGFISAVLGMYAPNIKLNTTLPKNIKEDPYIPTDDEISKLAAAIRGSRYEIAIILASFALRRSEICALTLDDVGEDFITINKAKVMDKNNNWVIRHMTKTENSARTVLIPRHITDMIREKGCIYDGCPNSIYTYLIRKEKELGIQHFSVHKLRHYYASMAHTLGIPDAYIMTAGGWKSDHVLKSVYRHAQKDKALEMQKKAAAKLESLIT